jgi:hypothetical protein
MLTNTNGKSADFWVGFVCILNATKWSKQAFLSQNWLFEAKKMRLSQKGEPHV